MSQADREDSTLTVAQLGELGLLRRLQRFCADMGNDGAVLPCPEADLVVTTDVLVADVHFSDRTTPPDAVGWRAVAANLSDLAAMGATPLGITVGLGLPGTVSVAWVEAVYGGMARCLATYGGDILGGDLVRSPQVSLAITALGTGAPHRILRRDRAVPGQLILATGSHGAARAGLELLLHPDQGQSLPPWVGDRFIAAHQYPCPRFDVVAALAQRLPEDQPWAIAAMDSSDGLANGVLHLCQASGVGARLERSRLPLPPGLGDWVGLGTATQWSLYGGEDFELVLTLAPDLALEMAIALGPEATLIGTVEPTPEVLLVTEDGSCPDLPLTWEHSFRHF